MDMFCRTCLRVSKALLPLFVNEKLCLEIKDISDVEVFYHDKLPQKICEECVKSIRFVMNFRKVIINTNNDLKERLYWLENAPNDSSIVKRENGDVVPVESKFTKSAPNENTELKVAGVRKRKSYGVRKYGVRNGSRLNKRKVLKQCSRCDFTTTEVLQFKSHWRNHIPRKVCDICGKLVTYENLTKHVENHKVDPVSCKDCGKVLKNRTCLRFHEMYHQGKRFHPCTCNVCGKTYNFRQSLRNHMKSHMSEEEKMKCTQCDKTFCTSTALKTHMRVHTGERPYPCPYCPKRLSSRNALKTHIRLHTKETPYICPHCPMAFKQRVSMRTHIKSKHNKAETDVSTQMSECV